MGNKDVRILRLVLYSTYILVRKRLLSLLKFLCELELVSGYPRYEPFETLLS